MILLLLLAAAPMLLSSGCASRRYKDRYQAEVDSMRAEYFELEDRYYEAIGELETTQRRLERLEAGASGDTSLEDNTLPPSNGANPRSGAQGGRRTVLPMPERGSGEQPGTATPDDADPQESDSQEGDNEATRPVNRPSIDELPQPNPNDSIEPQMPESRWRQPRTPGRITQRNSGANDAAQRSLPARSLQRDYLDPAETAAEREERFAQSAAEQGRPYFPAQPDERGLLAPQNELEPNQTDLAADLADPLVSDDSEIGWQEPLNGQPEAIVDWEVVRITVDHTRTRGYDSNGIVGDEGVHLVIHPRNAAGQSIPVFAPLTVAIYDPLESDEAQRLGIWEFSADELEYRQPPAAGMGQGISIRIPWRHGMPRHPKVSIFVRYEAGEGLRLETKTDLTVDIGSEDQSAWSTRSTPLRGASTETRTTRRGQEPSSAPSSIPSPTPSIPARQVSDPSSPRTGRPAWSPLR